MTLLRCIPLVFISLALGCGDRNADAGGTMAPGCPDSGARVFLSAQGDVTLNGRPVGISALKDALSSLSPVPTVICYSRENPSAEPHPSFQAVLEAMMATQLPIGLYTDATFTVPVKPE